MCGDIIEYKHRHDLVKCKCGACAVDGGHDYLRRCCKNKDDVDAEMKLLRQAVVDAEGGRFYDNEIFYYESVIYGRVLKQLLDEGFFVWMCYDAFYSTVKECWDQKRFEKYVELLVEYHANKFINEMKLVDKLNNLIKE